MTPSLKLLRDFLYFPTTWGVFFLAAQNPQKSQGRLILGTLSASCRCSFTPDLKHPRMRACPETLGGNWTNLWPAVKNATNRCTRWWQLKHFFIFIPNLGERLTHFDEHIFQMGWFNHQPKWRTNLAVLSSSNFSAARRNPTCFSGSNPVKSWWMPLTTAWPFERPGHKFAPGK